MGPGGGDDPGGGAKRSPLLEFMRRDLAENAPKRPGAAGRGGALCGLRALPGPGPRSQASSQEPNGARIKYFKKVNIDGELRR